MSAKSYQFQAETKQLLSLFTHSLYSDSEVFLRELIANGSDAIEKLRFESVKDTKLHDGSPFAIYISIDKEKKTIVLSDNGIGMSLQELEQNLGTIAKSGTRNFLAAKSDKDAQKDALIGQFGVGFYSAFIVADCVEVLSKKAGQTTANLWSSKGDGSFTIAEANKDNQGTEVRLHLKEDQQEWLEHYRLKGIIKKYSDHIGIPIYLSKDPASEKDEDKKDEKQDQSPYELVNETKAFWMLPKNTLKEEQYHQFYQTISYDTEKPLTYTHNRVEGDTEYTTLFFIPTNPPFDLWNPESSTGVKLYVRKVFIMDDHKKLLPNYLRFVKGLVDASDLSLNVSREILQKDRRLQTIKKGCTKRILNLLADMAKKDKERYQTFWKAFGNVLKEGPSEDYANRDPLLKLMRFASTHSNDPQQQVSLEDYVARMGDKQETIYYMIGESFEAACHSPHLEIFRKKNIEVLLLTDRIDEWLCSGLDKFMDKSFQSVTKGSVDLESKDDSDKKDQEPPSPPEWESVLKQMSTALAKEVDSVKVSKRLTDSPACLVVKETDASLHLRRILKDSGQQAPETLPTLEVNPEHTWVKRLQSIQSDDDFAKWSSFLYESALIAEGGKLKDPSLYVKRIAELMEVTH